MARPTLPLWLLRDAQQAQLLRLRAEVLDLAVLKEESYQKLIDTMVTTMYKARGIGLAAPQIGRSIRLAVIAPEVDDRLREPLVLVNPKIHAPSATQETVEEGCLSVPKVFGEVTRSLALTLKAFDRFGQPYTLQADRLLARVIQHEIDHLDGRLFVDRTSHITSGQKYLP